MREATVIAIAVAIATAALAVVARPAEADTADKMHLVFVDGRGRRALVSDTLVMASAARAVRSFASHFGDWRFVGPLSAAYRTPSVVQADAERALEHPLAVEGFRFATDLHRPWFGRASVARALMDGANEILPPSEARVDAQGDASEPAWQVLHATVVNVRRGDAARIAAACPPSGPSPWASPSCGPPAPGGVNGTNACPGDAVGLVVLNTASARSRQDDYAEVSLLEPLAPGAAGPPDGLDIFAGARLREGRAIVFPCDTPYRIAPPAVSTPKAVLLLRVVLTRDGTRAATATARARRAHAARGNSLPERLGFPASLFPDDVVAAQVAAIEAVEAEEAVAEGADAVASRTGQNRSAQGGAGLGEAAAATPEERAADAALASAMKRTKAAEAAARALSDAGDGWAAPLAAALNVSAKEARVFETAGGRRVHVFDGLFADAASQAMLRQLRDHVVANASYSFDDSTNEETADDTDNVQWIVGLDESFVVRTRLWPAFRAVADQVTPWPGFWPYDVSVNVIRAWDHTLVHADCAADELEYTLLLYLNDDLGLDDGGETVFFDDSAAVAGKGGAGRLLHRAGGSAQAGSYVPSGAPSLQSRPAAEEDGGQEDDEDEEEPDDGESSEWSEAYGEGGASEDGDDGEDDDDASSPGGGGGGYGSAPRSTNVLAVVRPVFGRVAIFNGNVPHSARPPYGTYPGIRYTLAVKMTSSRVSAVAKNLASMVHGTMDELASKVEGEDEGETGSAAVVGARRRKWAAMLTETESMYGEVLSLKKRATAADMVSWSGAKPRSGQPWSTTCLTEGPPPMTADPANMERLRVIAAKNHVMGEKVEKGGWQELGERLGLDSSALNEADDL